MRTIEVKQIDKNKIFVESSFLLIKSTMTLEIISPNVIQVNMASGIINSVIIYNEKLMTIKIKENQILVLDESKRYGTEVIRVNNSTIIDKVFRPVSLFQLIFGPQGKKDTITLKQSEK